MHRTRTSAGFVLGTGLVTWALSERAFWGRLRPDDGIADSLMTIVAYTCVGYLALLLLRRFDVCDARRLLLVGAALGWIVEGAVVATVYAQLPLSISWTALGWHAPISVAVGWHLLPRALRAGGRSAMRATLALGGALGLWSAFMAADAGVAPAAGEAAVSAALVAGALAAGYAIQGRARPAPQRLRPGRVGAAVAALVTAWAAVLVVPAVPFAPLVLAPLLWLVARGLRRTAPAAAPGVDALATAVPGVPLRRLAPLAALPAIAAAVTALAGATGHAVVIGYVALAILAPGGALAFAWAAGVRRPRRRRTVLATGGAA